MACTHTMMLVPVAYQSANSVEGEVERLTMTMIKTGRGTPEGTVSSTSFFSNCSIASRWTIVEGFYGFWLFYVRS
jgi:hypothetical protein